MPFQALAIANEFIERAQSAQQSLSPLKLQKLIYYANGWNLALTGQPLINERIEAWPFGPVISDVYHDFKRYGGGNITELGTSVEMNDDGRLVVSMPKLEDNDEDVQVRYTKKLLDKIWTEYSRYSAITLSEATHAPGTPWAETYDENTRGKVIPDDLIKKYFVQKRKPSVKAAE